MKKISGALGRQLVLSIGEMVLVISLGNTEVGFQMLIEQLNKDAIEKMTDCLAGNSISKVLFRVCTDSNWDSYQFSYPSVSKSEFLPVAIRTGISDAIEKLKKGRQGDESRLLQEALTGILSSIR